MKKRLFYLLFVALAAMSASLLSLTSCSKDDEKKEEIDPVAELKAKFVGEWNYAGTYDNNGKRMDNIKEVIRKVFDADGTLTNFVDGEKRIVSEWEVKIDGSERTLIMEKIVMKIKDVSANAFQVTDSEDYYYLYVRANDKADQK